jgi:diguanylate cyclase (GGDEF)-like protein
VRRYLLAAFLGVALIAAVGGVLFARSLDEGASSAAAASQAWQTGTAAADLLAAEQRIEARLVSLAADPAVARLAEGRPTPRARQAATAGLASLRELGDAVVPSACVVRPGSGRLTALDLVAGGTAACQVEAVVAAAITAADDDVVRARVRAPDGSARLVVATPMAAPDGAEGSVLAAEIDLAALFEATPTASAAAPASLLVDARSSDILARSDVPDPTGDGRAVPNDIQVYLSGILGGHDGTIQVLAGMGWLATFAPALPTIAGSSLGIVHVWGLPAPPSSVGPVLGLVLLGVLSLSLVAFVVARHFLRPFDQLAESRAQLQVLYREAREDALHDGMTGLGNHRAFQDELSRQVDLFMRRREPFALALLDVDDLKRVNDSEGHTAGDEVLVSLARTMRQAFRHGDRLFRIGGDEFAVLLPGADADVASALAERLLHFCQRPPGGERRCTFSCGISAMPRFSTDRTSVYRQADAALYWAKRHGRVTIEVFDADRDQPSEAVLQSIDSAVYDIVRGRLISPVFQPIIDLASGTILGFEGLVRPDPSGPLPDAPQLFAAATTTGRTIELDLACLSVVAAGARQLAPEQLLSVNLSPKTLEYRDFETHWLLDDLLRAGIDPRRVIVELTERDPIRDMARLQRNLAHLQQYGVRLAADDVGAGNAGLRMLSQLQFDVVKIDLTLVHEGVQRTGSRAVLRSIRDLALRQDALLIAEGVETEDQLRVICDLGIPAAQGYLLGRPRPTTSHADAALRELVLGSAFETRVARPLRADARPVDPLALQAALAGTSPGIAGRGGAARPAGSVELLAMGAAAVTVEAEGSGSIIVPALGATA